MTATIDRLNEARTDAADRCMLLGAVASTLDTLHDELLEQRDRHDAIIDAVMDALARVRPGWERTKRNWEAPRITTYVDASDAERRLDEARAEVERLRAEVASLREQSGDNDCDDAPDTDEPAGWEPALQWNVNEHGQRVVVNSSGRTVAWVDDYGDRPWCFRAGVLVDSLKNPWRSREDCTDIRAAMRWCEQQPEMADIIAAYTSAPTVGATDAGPDAPALIVEGDGDTGALQESAVPAAPVSGAEQSCGETGVDRPRDDLRGPDTEEVKFRKLERDLRSARWDAATLRVLLRDLSLLLAGNGPPLTAEDIVLRDERRKAATILAKACFRDHADDTLLGHARHAVEVMEELHRQHRDVLREREYAMTELADMAGRLVASDDISNLIEAVEAVRDELSYRSEPDTPIDVFDSNGYRLCVGDLVLLSAHPDDESGSPGGDEPWTVDGVFQASGKVLLACGSWRAVRDAGTCTLAPVAQEDADGEG